MVAGRNERQNASIAPEDETQSQSSLALKVISAQSPDAYSRMEVRSTESVPDRLQRFANVSSLILRELADRGAKGRR